MALRINVPPITRALLGGLLVVTSVNAVSGYRSWTSDQRAEHFSLADPRYYTPYCTIVPRVSILYPWVFVTATFAENHVLGLLASGITLFYGGRYLERAWSSAEFIKFIAFVSVLPNVLSFLTYVSIYAVTRHENLLSRSINGGLALQAAFLVAFKQLVPEHTVALGRGFVRIRVKHFPAMFLLVYTVSGLVFGRDTAALLSWLGFLTSWTYLRFYRTSPALTSVSTGDGRTLRGDASDTFAFASFFPDIVQPPIAAFCDAVFKALVIVKLCTPFSAEDIEAGNDQASARSESGLPSVLDMGGTVATRSGGKREEAERRRALALRALDQRLQGTTIVRPPPVANARTESTTLGETTYEPEAREERIMVKDEEA